MAMSQWWRFNETWVNTERDEGGVYELGDSAQQVVYIGSSAAVKTRLKSHLAGDDLCITLHAQYYRVDYRSDYRAEELRRYNAYVRLHGTPPKCNNVAPPGR